MLYFEYFKIQLRYAKYLWIHSYLYNFEELLLAKDAPWNFISDTPMQLLRFLPSEKQNHPAQAASLYGASGAHIAHPEFIDQTWVPWTEMWTLPDSWLQRIVKMWKSEMIYERRLIAFAHCRQTNIPGNQPSLEDQESHVNRVTIPGDVTAVFTA